VAGEQHQHDATRTAESHQISHGRAHASAPSFAGYKSRVGTTHSSERRHFVGRKIYESVDALDVQNKEKQHVVWDCYFTRLSRTLKKDPCDSAVCWPWTRLPPSARFVSPWNTKVGAMAERGNLISMIDRILFW
jgi:hypothetical protein